MTMTSEDEDFILSLQLSIQLNEEHEYHKSLLKLNETSIEEPVGRSVVSHSSRKDLSVVDEFWELHDPNPDVHSLFVEFNKAYFYGKLDQVAVRWSWRMTLCAGLCQYEGKGGLCTVKLSEPLLKLRPRKDLVETLLHEMIHAYLFVTDNNKDHNAHGPEFHKHMDRINKASGANITVFHNFHGEVDNYRTHWWRCNGPCQHRMPFFGIVKRAMNRPPSERDPWWADHQRKCGGSFTKIREPEPKSSKGKRKDTTLPAKNAAKKPKLADGADIRTLLVSSPSVSKPAASVSASQGHQSNHPKHVSSFPGIMTKLPSNIHTLSQHAIDQQRSQVALYSGKGHTLRGCSTKSRLLEEGSSRNESIVESSCVLGSVTRQMQDLRANEATSGSSTVSRSGQSVNKCVTETEVKPTLPKPSRSTQPTLKDFLIQKKPAERTSRKSSAAKMKFIRELFSSDSDSDSDDDCIITTDMILKDQGKCTGKLGEASTSSSLNSVDIGAAANVSIGNGLALVECPACTHFVEGRLINSHLDECLRPDD